MTEPADRCRLFRQLHESGCFVIPNPWDAGTAKLFASLGFEALATTSLGLANALGRVDGAIRPEAFQHCTEVKQPRGCWQKPSPSNRNYTP